MPVVTCPKCPTKLKVPDGASGNTKCPKCGTVFPVSAPAAPASPPPPAAPAPASRPVMKPVQKAEEPDFEEVDEKPKKRSRADDDDDDDDDRPRKKKRSRDDDDDDDDDRPRKKKGKKKKASRDDDDDDDDWAPKASSKGAAFAKAKTGSNLIAIGFWLNLGAYGVLALYALIMWVMYLSASSGSSSSRRSSGSGGDGSFMDVVVMLPGLVGLGGWIVGIVGTSFAIAGPKKARAMAITATALAGVHLLLTGVTFSNMQDGIGLPLPGLRKIGWIAMATTLWAVDALLPVLFYFSKGLNGDFTLAILAGLCEIGRLVFMLLTLKALASAARDNDAAEKAQSGVMLSAFITGGAAILTLLVFIVIYEAKSSSLVHLGFLTMILIFVGYTFMMLPAAMSAMQTRDACDR
ncbi:MAG: hypothetical protein FJ304_18175 [Planctomycetes bacterium]|nr:hypothetical protein [Planctomycetota bacterium]